MAGLEEGSVHQRILEVQKLGAGGRSVSREVQDRDPAKPRQLYATHVVLKPLESSVYVSPGFRCLYSGTQLRYISMSRMRWKFGKYPSS